jgi:SulP family sulfate permease
VANVVSGTFRGLPLGGSVGGTGIVISTGARSRWANVFLGAFVAIFVIFFSNAVEQVAMPAIAGALILVGVSIIAGNMEEFRDVWDVSMAKRVIMLATFLATLVLPVQTAVLLGVFLSFVDFAFSASQKVTLLALRPTADNTFIEEVPPAQLADHSTTILFARGNLYFAAVRTIQEQLPAAREAQHAVVILRLRGSSEIGSTFIAALERYADELAAHGGKVLLSGVSEEVLAGLLRTETHETVPLADIFMATPVLGESTRAALAAAQAWQTEQGSEGKG